MATNTDLAQDYFGDYIQRMSAYGPKQVSHTIKKLSENFYGLTLQSFATAALDDIMAKHKRAALSGSTLDTDDFQAVTLKGGDGLAVRLEDGNKVLIGWWNEPVTADADDTDDNGEDLGIVDISFSILPFHDLAPTDFLAEIETGLKTATSIRQLNDLATRATAYGGFQKDRINLYNGMRISLEEAIRGVEQDGINKFFWSKGIGTVHLHTYTIGGIPMLNAQTSGGQNRDIEFITRIARSFLLKKDKRSAMEARGHLKALIAGDTVALGASVVAMTMEHVVNKSMQDIEALVGKASEMGLSKDMTLAYADTDIRVNVHRHDGADVWFHDNIDLNEGNALVTVLNGERGAYSSIDVYLSRAWWRDADIDSMDDVGQNDAVVDRSAFLDRIALATRLSCVDYQIGEDDLHAAVAAGDKPSHGRVLSYDIASKTVEVYPDMVQTDYVSYLPLMIEGTLDTMTKILSGDTEEMWGTEFHRREPGATEYIHVDLDDHLENRAPTP